MSDDQKSTVETIDENRLKQTHQATMIAAAAYSAEGLKEAAASGENIVAVLSKSGDFSNAQAEAFADRSDDDFTSFDWESSGGKYGQ